MFLRVNGLFGHVKQNDLRSVVSFLGFAVAIQLVAGAVLLIPLLFIDPLHSPLNPGGYLFRYGSAVMLITCGLFIWRYDRYCEDMEEAIGFGLMPIGSQRLQRAVREMATTAGIACPRVAMIESTALNAFACGTKPENSVVVATRGLIDALDDRELRAVVAHEVTHIKNGDIRFMASAHVLFGIIELFASLNKFRLKERKSSWRMFAAPGFYALPAIASAAAGIAFMIARWTRSGVSLSREFIADAEAVRLSQDAGALVSALRKVEGRSKVDNLRPEFEAMMIDGAARGSNPTHPPIAERIAALVRLAGPAASEHYTSAPITPSQRGFGRRGTASPFHQPMAPAFAGMGAGEVTAEETMVRDYFQSQTREENMKGVKALLILIPIAGAMTAMVGGGFASAPAPEPARVRTIADASPATGCFPRVTDIATRKLYPVSLNPALIDAWRRRVADTEEIQFERYVALHRGVLLDTQLTSPERLDLALMDYVAARKLHLESAAVFFGQDGLDAMQREYAGAGDAALVAQIRARLAANAQFPPVGKVSVGDLRALAANPAKFAPCRQPTRDTA